VQGVRGNQLVGYGLVMGLEGTGDGQQSLFTVQSVMNMLRKFGVTLNITPQQMQVKNVAAVMVTADLPPFAKNGSRFDVTVSSIGDAKALQGGTLVRTPLLAANGEIYAVAQGPLSIGGFNFGSGGTSVQKNFVNVGRIPGGATVEQEVPVTLSDNGLVQITLREPDFTTVSRIAAALRKEKFSASALDAATVSVGVPKEAQGDIIGFIASIENISVTPDSQAKIVINERTGTVVMGGRVQLAPGAVAHGSISIRIENTPVIIPAVPFNPNPGQVVPLQDTQVTEKKGQLAVVPATTTVDQLVRAMNTLGVTPRDLINILQAMRAARMINAAIEVQ
jgi:flagellar P-ring protein FlgI